jgi:hypothetical protein
MELSSVLLKLLSCPLTGSELIYDRKNKELISEKAGLAYPIIDGIPILLADKARKINAKASDASSHFQAGEKRTEVA